MAKKKNPFKQNKKQLPITRMEFAEMHYEGEQYPSDLYYTGLANDILKVINRHLGEDDDNFPFHIRRRAALVLAAHVEDLIAGNMIWSSFLSLYKKKYGKAMPFYNIEEDPTFGYDEAPSITSFKFLLWYVFNDHEENTLINPLNEGIELMATDIGMTIMGKIEDAPETPMRPQLRPEKECGVPVIFQIRNLCHWLLWNCYLTRVWDRDYLIEEATDLIEKMFNFNENDDYDKINYGVFSYLAFNAYIGPLAITPYEWISEIITIEPEPEEIKYLRILKEFKSQPIDFYKFKRVDKKSAKLTTRVGNEIKMSAYTLPDEIMPEYMKRGETLISSLVYFDGAWCINGITMTPLPAKMFDDAVDKFENLTQHHRLQYDFNVNHLKNRIGVMKSYDEYMSHFPELKNVTNTTDPNVDMEHIKHAKNIVYFVSEEGNVTLLPDFADCIKIKNNPFYDSENAQKSGFILLMAPDIIDQEMRDYLIENNLVPDAAMNSRISPEAGHRLFQDNVRFLSRLHLRDTLIPSPAIKPL